MHWIPVKYHRMFKLVVYTFKALHVSALTLYSSILIRLELQSNYNLQSNTKHLLLNLPNNTKKTTGDRVFCAAGLTLWNTLSDKLKYMTFLSSIYLLTI